MLSKIILVSFVVGSGILFERYLIYISKQLESIKSEINNLKKERSQIINSGEETPDTENLKTRIVQVSRKFPGRTIVTLNDGTAWISDDSYTLLYCIDENGTILQKLRTYREVNQFQRGTDSYWLYTSLYHNKYSYSVWKITEFVDVFFIDTEPFIPFSLHVTSSGVVYIGCIESKNRSEATDNYNGYVLKVTKDGSPLQKYERDENKNRLFSMPFRIHENTNGDIWICDWVLKDNGEIGKITVLDRNGIPKFNYTGVKSEKTENPFFPTDFVSIGNGIMLVLDNPNNIIHVVNENGRWQYFLRPDDDEDFKEPFSISFDKISKKLWVGTERNGIFVLNLD